MGRLDGKHVLITGGARGMGAAEAALFVGEGATVCIADVLDEEGEATAEALGDAANYHHLDVRNAAAWATTVEGCLARYGKIDCLLNNAGVYREGNLETTTAEDWEFQIGINQTGVLLGMQAVAPSMREMQRGSIVNISSIAGLRGTPNCIGYGASKWAVRGMTKSAAKELAPFNVRVNSIHPGLIETDMLPLVGPPEMLGPMVPMGRTAHADEVADTALFLASDDSKYTTGTEFVVDGGFTA
ncbi:MAG: glucose 1-dehydrogenase [Acidimicrobiales bacterium]